MKFSGILVTLACLVIGLAAAPAAQQVNPRSASVLAGETRVTTSTDGLTAIVSVDLAGGGAVADGVVDEAFRIQFSAPARLAYAGPATLVFTGSRLSIRVGGLPGWTFLVEGSPLTFTPGDQQVLEVVGLGQFWGTSVQGTHDQVATRLLSAACTTSSVQPLGLVSCADCMAGGPGSPDCFISCGGSGGCSVNCSGTAYACCTCGGCRCCR
jgi:hypothetical protein